MVIILEILKSIQITIVLLKLQLILDAYWSTTLLLIWPMFYLIIGIFIIIFFQFVMKLLNCTLHSQNRKKTLVLFLIILWSLLLLTSLVLFGFTISGPVRRLDLNLDRDSPKSSLPNMYDLSVFSFLAGVGACLTVIFSGEFICKIIKSEMLEEINEELTLPEKSENKVKVKYPLFVKKSAANVFAQALREDIKKINTGRKRKLVKKTAPIPKEPEIQFSMRDGYSNSYYLSIRR